MAGTYRNQCAKCHKVFEEGDKAVATSLVEVAAKSRHSERVEAHYKYSRHRSLTCLKCAEEELI